MRKSSSREAVRLNRFLAMLGIGSRRDCDAMIAAGRVKVDGRSVTTPGLRVVPGVHRVAVDDQRLDRPPGRVVLMLNKPTGVVSTVSDPFGRPTVIDLCRHYARSSRLFPVGRLDIGTTGLLLLTNDGLLCYHLTHPRFGVPRTYYARVRGVMNEKKLERLRRLAGPRGADGEGQSPVGLVKERENTSVLAITLREGRNRQVRRMCESVGLRVVRLRRVQFGPLSIRKLPLGAVRPLSAKETAALDRLIESPEPPRVGPRGGKRRRGHRQAGQAVS